MYRDRCTIILFIKLFTFNRYEKIAKLNKTVIQNIADAFDAHVCACKAGGDKTCWYRLIYSEIHAFSAL